MVLCEGRDRVGDRPRIRMAAQCHRVVSLKFIFYYGGGGGFHCE